MYNVQGKKEPSRNVNTHADHRTTHATVASVLVWCASNVRITFLHFTKKSRTRLNLTNLLAIELSKFYSVSLFELLGVMWFFIIRPNF